MLLAAETDAVTAIGVVVAFLSFGVAVLAWRISHRSLDIASTEHKVFMDRVNARADFMVECYVVRPSRFEAGVFETRHHHVTIKWQMGITSTGDKAANDVGINFLIPRDFTDRFGWVTQTDEPLGDSRQHGPMTTAEELVATDGSRHPAHYLIKEIPRQPRRTARVLFAVAVAEMPPVGEERVVPYKFKVWSDDLPDDVEARTFEREFRLRRIE